MSSTSPRALRSPEAVARFQASVAAKEVALNAELEPYRKRYPGASIELRCPGHLSPKLLARGEIDWRDPLIRWRGSGSHPDDYPGRGGGRVPPPGGSPWYRVYGPKAWGESRPNVYIFDSTHWDLSGLPGPVAPGWPPLLSEQRFTIECTCGRRWVVKNERMVRRFMRALDEGQHVLLLGRDL